MPSEHPSRGSDKCRLRRHIHHRYTRLHRYNLSNKNAPARFVTTISRTFIPIRTGHRHIHTSLGRIAPFLSTGIPIIAVHRFIGATLELITGINGAGIGIIASQRAELTAVELVTCVRRTGIHIVTKKRDSGTACRFIAPIIRTEIIIVAVHSVWMQPSLESQEWIVQAFPSSQLIVPKHEPSKQASPPVQAFPSSHVISRFRTAQPMAWSQYSPCRDSHLKDIQMEPPTCTVR